jgi:hypothetical protein
LRVAIGSRAKLKVAGHCDVNLAYHALATEVVRRPTSERIVIPDKGQLAIAVERFEGAQKWTPILLPNTVAFGADVRVGQVP